MPNVSGPVTAVIVTYNSSAVLGDCLASLDAAMASIEDWRLIVVDNDSSDGSLGLACAQPRAQMLQTGRNGGYAAAINYALAHGDVAGSVLILNPDVRLRAGSVALLLQGMQRSHAGLAVPRLQSTDGDLLWSLRREPTVARALGEALVGGERSGRHPRWGELVVDPTVYEREGWADWATGAALLISAPCRAAVGAWDESFFLYSEETDYCLRARAAGFGIRYVPTAVADHLEGGGESSSYLRPFMVENKQRLFRRRHGVVSSSAFRAVGILNEGMRAARGSEPHRAGLRTLMGHRPRRPDEVDSTTETAGPDAAAQVADRRPVVLFSAQDYWYHNRAHSDVQLARNLARRRPVLLVNSLGMRMPTPGNTTQSGRRVLRKLRSISRAVRRPEPEYPNLYVMSPVSVPAYGNPAVRRLNAAFVRAQVRIALRLTGHGGRPDVVVTIPTAWDVVRRLPRHGLVINRSDKYSAFPETDQELMASFERELLGSCDAAMYVSHHLLEAEKPLVAGRSVFLGHGVDFDYFSQAADGSLPADLAAIPGPRIGFFGGIDDYVVDLDLLRRLAVELPQAQFVLIGDATCPMDELVALPNVHWLGVRPYEQIAAYGAGFDVAIMPWLVNEWIAHCNPIKAKEYLALGLPTVTTRYAEAAALEDVMDVAETPDEFVALVAKALDGGSRATPEQRQGAVRGDSWQARADEVLALFGKDA